MRGPKLSKSEPQAPQQKRPQERKCIASGQSRPRAALLRFVVGPKGTLVPDIENKLPGRGLWVTSTRAALETALSKKAFLRAAKEPVSVPSGIVELVERLLLSRAIEGLALSRRAGRVVAGFGKVENLVRNQPPAALFEASDGAEDGRRKLLGLAKAWQNDKKGPIPVIGSLDSRELGLAFGRGSVIHAALENSGFTARILADFRRLDGFRPWAPPIWNEAA